MRPNTCTIIHHHNGPYIHHSYPWIIVVVDDSVIPVCSHGARRAAGAGAGTGTGTCTVAGAGAQISSAMQRVASTLRVAASTYAATMHTFHTHPLHTPPTNQHSHRSVDGTGHWAQHGHSPAPSAGSAPAARRVHSSPACGHACVLTVAACSSGVVWPWHTDVAAAFGAGGAVLGQRGAASVRQRVRIEDHHATTSQHSTTLPIRHTQSLQSPVDVVEVGAHKQKCGGRGAARSRLFSPGVTASHTRVLICCPCVHALDWTRFWRLDRLSVQ